MGSGPDADAAHSRSRGAAGEAVDDGGECRRPLHELAKIARRRGVTHFSASVLVGSTQLRASAQQRLAERLALRPTAARRHSAPSGALLANREQPMAQQLNITKDRR